MKSPVWLWFVVVGLLCAVPFLNYEIGYENGTRGCYGCGIFDEALIPHPWGPLLDFN